jgi:hypothetical protein
VHWFKEICQLALIVVASPGCLIGFDANRLTGGAEGGAPASDLGSGCDDFSTYATGERVPNWIDGRGTWRVVLTGDGHALTQMDDVWSGERYVAWYGGKQFTDVDVSAIVSMQASTAEACVLVRVQDASTYYALCTHAADDRHPTPEWRLNRMTGGTSTRLSSGTLGDAASHLLGLGAHGSRLSAVVDGAQVVAYEDGTLSNGNVGVSTDWSGVFTTFCMVGR